MFAMTILTPMEGLLMATKPSRIIITGVPPYDQQCVVKENGKSVIAGCGPTAALALLAYYDRALGYRKLVRPNQETVTDMPDDLVLELRKKMHTINDLHNGQEWGMTLPPTFHAGLKDFVNDRYPGADVDTKGSDGFNTVQGVFERAVELLQAGQPHILLFDWRGDSGIFPNHYVVVVGYRNDGNFQTLIVNDGWGNDFHRVDLNDDKVKPVRLYWLEMGTKPDGPADGHQIGPSTHYTWVKVGGTTQLQPTIYQHFSYTETFAWQASAEVAYIANGTEVAHCKWYD